MIFDLVCGTRNRAGILVSRNSGFLEACSHFHFCSFCLFALTIQNMLFGHRGLLRLPRGEETRFWGLVVRPASRKDWARCCWAWRGGKDSAGVPTFEGLSLPSGDRFHVHANVMAFTLLHGLPPSGAPLAFRCGNRGCVNPSHLVPRRSPKNPMLHKMAALTFRRPRGRPKKVNKIK